jgi:hypothetical protein
MFFSLIHVTSLRDEFPCLFSKSCKFFGGLPGETGPGAGSPGGRPNRFDGPTELVF